MPPTSRTISLEIDTGRGPLHGRVAHSDGSSDEFEGWLGLLTILGSLLDGPAPGGEPSPPWNTPQEEPDAP